MSPTHLLRSSRDGDQFHPHWGARQSLRPLNPNTELAAFAVEASHQERPTRLPARRSRRTLPTATSTIKVMSPG